MVCWIGNEAAWAIDMIDHVTCKLTINTVTVFEDRSIPSNATLRWETFFLLGICLQSRPWEQG